MFRTDDNYNLYYDERVSQDLYTDLKKLIEEHQLTSEFLALLGNHFNFSMHNTYSDHRKFLWVLYQTLGPFAITILFAEENHPHGCEYQARVDFLVDGSGSFDYELKNSLFLYETRKLSDACEERIARGSIGFEPDLKMKGNLATIDLEAFLATTTTK